MVARPPVVLVEHRGHHGGIVGTAAVAAGADVKVTMAAFSGRIAGLALVEDLASRARSFPVAMPGGTPTR